MVGSGVEQTGTNRVCFLLGTNKQLLEHESLLWNTGRQFNQPNFYANAWSNADVNQYFNSHADRAPISHADSRDDCLHSKQFV